MLADLEGGLAGEVRLDPDLPESHFLALHRFKGLRPLFEEVEFFIAVIATHAEGLDPRKRRNADEQLDLLRRRLARLHLESAAPLLRLLERKHEPLPLGTRYVLESWLSGLDRMEQDLVSARAQPDWPALDALLGEVRSLSLALHQRAPDLPDFSAAAETPAQQPVLPPRLPVTHPPHPAPAVADRHPVPEVVTLVLQRREGAVFVDGSSSGPLMAEIHRLGLGPALVDVLGVRPALLPMLLAGHDPIPLDRIDPAVAFLRDALGEQRFHLVRP
ncbi:hypothetical protein RC1_3801 [Rhodospirillum centenum SW]|uniref:Uncharacterized protein n=1 Tax=Rhodospirillum centenum (strain ATCC 51521 / SW) TaxID=414684 RepID=B6IXX0_RHOCS|nr:hypothetical protein RC1_3801 [Rhodospirillum centenum SW]